jgi:hypothetical protein
LILHAWKIGGTVMDEMSIQKVTIPKWLCYRNRIGCKTISGNLCWCCLAGRCHCYVEQSECEANCHAKWIIKSPNNTITMWWRASCEWTMGIKWLGSECSICQSFLVLAHISWIPYVLIYRVMMISPRAAIVLNVHLYS